MTGKKKTFLLIDIPSLTHRAYFAMPSMKYDGREVGCVFGFTRMFWMLYRRFSPCFVIGAEDSRESERKKDYSEYKANRVSAPDEFYAQLPYIYEFLELVGVRVVKVMGFEADDVLGSLSLRLDGDKIIVTGDKDMFQLVKEDILIAYYVKKKLELCDRNWVYKKFGVYPEQFVDYLALVGDSVDNIVGIKGIGPVKARRLLREFGSLDNLFVRINDIKEDKLRMMLLGNKETVERNKNLIRIRVDLEVPSSNLKENEIDWDGLYSFYQRFGFKSLIREQFSGKGQSREEKDSKEQQMNLW